MGDGTRFICVLRFMATDGRYYSNFKSENFEVE
jgi:hypothetical protein